MKFTNRETEFPGRRRLIKVDENNEPTNNEPILAYVIKEEGEVIIDGTPMTADNLNKGNWRDDDSLSFRKKDNNGPFTKEKGVTQIITTVDGETWIVPPAECSGQAMKIVSSMGTAVKINGIVQQDLIFASDPQAQITAVRTTADTAKGIAETAQGTANGKSIVNVNSTKADVNFTSDPQAQINSKSTVKVNGSIQSEVGFISDPQAQINSKASQIEVNNIKNDYVDRVYPIGSIYMSTASTEPSALFGIGSWQRFGNGRVLVGVDEGDTDFNTAQKAAGAKTVVLTEAQMPAHTHMQNAHGHDFLSDSGLGLEVGANTPDSANLYSFADNLKNGSRFGIRSTTAVNQNAGGNGAHSNLQPYITVYMWVRVA